MWREAAILPRHKHPRMRGLYPHEAATNKRETGGVICHHHQLATPYRQFGLFKASGEGAVTVHQE